MENSLGYKVIGHVPRCSCGGTVNYSRRYDAHYCEGCNTWLEGKCKDSDCDFCVNRPERPLNVSHLPRVEGDGGLVSSRL